MKLDNMASRGWFRIRVVLWTEDTNKSNYRFIFKEYPICLT